MFLSPSVVALGILAVAATGRAAEIRANNQPAQLDIRAAGERSIRVTLKPLSFKPDFPFTPALAEREYADASISLRELSQAVKA
jgi:alpha-glucosidase/alpha-D-xyloside xylohydrolase